MGTSDGDGRPSKHVFLSHASEDRAYAESIADAMRSKGIDVWMYPTDRDGWTADAVKWYDQLEAQLDRSALIVLLMSRQARASHWVMNELLRARRLRIPVRPLLLDGDLWLALESDRFVDVRDRQMPPEDFFSDLKGAVEGHGGNESNTRAADLVESLAYSGDDPVGFAQGRLKGEITRLRRFHAGPQGDQVVLAVSLSAEDSNVDPGGLILGVHRVGVWNRFRARLLVSGLEMRPNVVDRMTKLGWKDAYQNPSTDDRYLRIFVFPDWRDEFRGASSEVLSHVVARSIVDVFEVDPGHVLPLPALVAPFWRGDIHRDDAPLWLDSSDQ